MQSWTAAGLYYPQHSYCPLRDLGISIKYFIVVLMFATCINKALLTGIKLIVGFISETFPFCRGMTHRNNKLKVV